jgi:hypothetical protein
MGYYARRGANDSFRTRRSRHRFHPRLSGVISTANDTLSRYAAAVIGALYGVASVLALRMKEVGRPRRHDMPVVGDNETHGDRVDRNISSHFLLAGCCDVCRNCDRHHLCRVHRTKVVVVSVTAWLSRYLVGGQSRAATAAGPPFFCSAGPYSFVPAVHVCGARRAGALPLSR